MATNSPVALDLLEASLSEVLKRPALEIPVRQRAKFEGWLKVEFAYALEQRGVSVSLEDGIPRTNHRADIQAKLGADGPALVMLKTINTNFRFNGVDPRHRPITRNISGIIEDLVKLGKGRSPTAGLVVFAIFPVAANEQDRQSALGKYIARISQSGCRISRSGFVVPPYSEGHWGISWFIGTGCALPQLTIT